MEDNHLRFVIIRTYLISLTKYFMGMKDLIQEQLLQAGRVSSVMPEILRMDRCRRRWTGADGWRSLCRASLPSLLTPSPPIGGEGYKEGGTVWNRMLKISVIGYAELKVRGRKRKDYPTPCLRLGKDGCEPLIMPAPCH